jgi:phenylpyruvate tautomerase PptA (4-oxalocrotonate tautomerase family)
MSDVNRRKGKRGSLHSSTFSSVYMEYGKALCTHGLIVCRSHHCCSRHTAFPSSTYMTSFQSSLTFNSHLKNTPSLVLPQNLPIFFSMPLYEIHHSVSLLSAQLSALALAITDLHCNTFSAPSSFVNVVFYPATTSETTIGPAVYVGGKKVPFPTHIELQQSTRLQPPLYCNK